MHPDHPSIASRLNLRTRSAELRRAGAERRGAFVAGGMLGAAVGMVVGFALASSAGLIDTPLVEPGCLETSRAR